MAISKFQNFEFQNTKFWKNSYFFSKTYNFFDFQFKRKNGIYVLEYMPNNMS